MKTMNNRIFNIIDCHPDLSDSKLAKHIGCSKSAVSRWRKEGLTPHSRFTSGIADFLGVTERYLLTGEDKNLYNKNFSTIIKDLRSQSGHTQESLAKALGVSKSRINMYERGEREPNFEMLKGIADFFNVDMNFLLGNDTATMSTDSLKGKNALSTELKELYEACKNATPGDIKLATEMLKRMTEGK